MRAWRAHSEIRLRLCDEVRLTLSKPLTRHPLKTLPIGFRSGRAGDETRTRDIFLGKEVLYQLSYTRVLSMRGRNDASDAGRIKKYLRAIDSVSCPRWVTHLPEEPRARI
jgi:hypothetical protein